MALKACSRAHMLSRPERVPEGFTVAYGLENMPHAGPCGGMPSRPSGESDLRDMPRALKACALAHMLSGPERVPEGFTVAYGLENMPHAGPCAMPSRRSGESDLRDMSRALKACAARTCFQGPRECLKASLRLW